VNIKCKSMIILFLCSGVIPSTTAASQIKISCIGNSITSGTSTSGTYVTTLGKLLGTTAYKIENDGVSGTTLLKSGDHPYWKEGKFNQVFALKPDIVTIKLGTNDTKPQNWDAHYGEFKKDYLAMIDTLNTLSSKPKIWIVLPVPCWANQYNIRDSALQKIIPLLKQIGQEKNLPVIDANTPLKTFSKYFSDGVHPNAAGSDTIAYVIYRALMSATSISNLTHPVIKREFPEVETAQKYFSLFVPSEGTTIRLYDHRGSIIHKQTFQTPGRHSFCLKNLHQAIYLLQMQRNGQPALCRTIAVP
jgi:lysophospholipase L1-like esterase